MRNLVLAKATALTLRKFDKQDANEHDMDAKKHNMDEKRRLNFMGQRNESKDSDYAWSMKEDKDETQISHTVSEDAFFAS